MKIAIIAAMPEEMQLFKKHLDITSSDTLAGQEFATASIEHHEVILVTCGVGKVSAAVGTTILMQNYKPDYVINIGVAGSSSTDFEIGDTIISNAVRYHDVDLKAFGYEHGQMSKMPVSFSPDPELIRLAENASKTLDNIHAKTALVVSGDAFLHTTEAAKAINFHFEETCAVEMEAGAIAQVCHLFQTPFVVIRAISDIVGQDNKNDFEEFLHVAAENAYQLTHEMISNFRQIKKP